jgi:hypothetical protein
MGERTLHRIAFSLLSIPLKNSQFPDPDMLYHHCKKGLRNLQTKSTT